MSLLPAIATAACTMLVASATVSCHRGQGGLGIAINKYEALKPDQFKDEQCALELAGTKYKAEVRRQQQGENLQLDLSAFGSIIDSERYRSTNEVFSLVEGGGER